MIGFSHLILILSGFYFGASNNDNDLNLVFIDNQSPQDQAIHSSLLLPHIGTYLAE
jgi:hypothetical protein